MKIQKMIIDDYFQINGLWRACGLSEEPEDQKEEVGALLGSAQGTGFVAKEGGEIVGAVLCGNDGRYGYIHHLAVSKNMRKQGIGKALVETCIRFLQRRHVIIMVRENNITANKFWEHMQFQNVNGLKVQYMNVAVSRYEQ